MTGNAFQVRILFHEFPEHFILLVIVRLKWNIILHVSEFRIFRIQEQMIRLNSEENIHIRKAHGAEIPRLFPAPELRAEVAVKADGQPFCFGGFQQIKNNLSAAF